MNMSVFRPLIPPALFGYIKERIVKPFGIVKYHFLDGSKDPEHK